MKICRKAEKICQNDGYISVMTNCVELRIWFLTDHIIRIRAGFDGDFEEIDRKSTRLNSSHIH